MRFEPRQNLLAGMLHAQVVAHDAHPFRWSTSFAKVLAAAEDSLPRAA
jgi:hypothetical protein